MSRASSLVSSGSAFSGMGRGSITTTGFGAALRWIGGGFAGVHESAGSPQERAQQSSSEGVAGRGPADLVEVVGAAHLTVHPAFAGVGGGALGPGH